MIAARSEQAPVPSAQIPSPGAASTVSWTAFTVKVAAPEISASVKAAKKRSTVSKEILLNLFPINKAPSFGSVFFTRLDKQQGLLRIFLGLRLLVPEKGHAVSSWNLAGIF
jgi:hypothetical protein